MTLLQAGKLVPMFSLPTSDGKDTIKRSDLRGKAALLILWMPPSDEQTQTYLNQLDQTVAEWGDQQQALVVSDTELSSLKHTTTLTDAKNTVAAQFFDHNEAKGAWFITDRYGELYAQGTAQTTSDLPQPAEFSEWLEYVNMRCSG